MQTQNVQSKVSKKFRWYRDPPDFFLLPSELALNSVEFHEIPKGRVSPNFSGSKSWFLKIPTSTELQIPGLWTPQDCGRKTIQTVTLQYAEMIHRVFQNPAVILTEWFNPTLPGRGKYLPRWLWRQIAEKVIMYVIKKKNIYSCRNKKQIFLNFMFNVKKLCFYVHF